MAELTRIDGVPVYSTLAEALAYGVSNGLTGYMAGSSHQQATSANDVDPFSSAGGNGALQDASSLEDDVPY